MKKPWPLLLLVVFLTFSSLDARESGKVFDRVAAVLESRFFDKKFRGREIPELARLFRPLAVKADSLEEERLVIHCFLSRIPVSHLAIYSEATFRNVINEIKNQRAPTFGFSLVEKDGAMFAHAVLEGGPAREAGLERWDRILAIDGLPPTESPRLDWRSDDAYLSDPPVHHLLCEAGDTITLIVERRPGAAFGLRIASRSYCTFDAAKASSRIISHQGKSFGYIHFWYMHNEGPSRLLTERIVNDFSKCDGLILDIRGRGGNGLTVGRVVNTLLARWHPRPLVVLVDAGTRSAKEILAYEIKRRWLGLIVGERTRGAVIPASFKKVGGDSVLIFPSFTLDPFTSALEGKGVEPDIRVEDAGPFSAGADPILEAGILALARGVCRV